MYKGIIWSREHLETYTILDMCIVCACVLVLVSFVFVCYQRKWGL